MKLSSRKFYRQKKEKIKEKFELQINKRNGFFIGIRDFYLFIKLFISIFVEIFGGSCLDFMKNKKNLTEFDKFDYTNFGYKHYRNLCLFRKNIKMKPKTELFFKLIWKVEPKIKNDWIDYLVEKKFITENQIKNFNQTIYYDIFMNYKREWRVKKFLENVYGWECEKTNNFYDKYHQIDLIAINKDNKDCLIQVKTKLYQNLKIDKLLKYAKKNDCIPYLAIVSDNQISIKKLKF